MTIKSEHFLGFRDDLSVVIAEIIVDTADELPGTDGIPGKILHQGSVAYVAKQGISYVLAGDGKWYASGGGKSSQGVIGSAFYGKTGIQGDLVIESEE